jgi:SAM-dependent methyltransferase
MTYRRILLNTVTLLPGVSRFPPIASRLRQRQAATQGTSSAAYCYGVWLRHLLMAARHGLDVDPADVAELGPGDSIGAGLAALLCGAERYTAMDAVSYAKAPSNAAILDELVELFRARSPIPDGAQVKPSLPDYAFPHHILTEERLRRSLAPERVARIRRAVLDEEPAGMIRYLAPWRDAAAVAAGSQDMVFSQAVLEHVDELAEAYRAMRAWLKPGGYISHQIDFKSHGYTDTWDGHWRCGDLRWALLRGRAGWFINRQPYSRHLELLRQAGFSVLYQQTVKSSPSYDRRSLARRFRAMAEDDRETSGAYVLAVPPSGEGSAALRQQSEAVLRAPGEAEARLGGARRGAAGAGRRSAAR